MMNPNMLARYNQWRETRIPRYANGTNQLTVANLAKAGGMPLPYANPDGMVRWDPSQGRYVTVPPPGMNTTPPPPWMGAMPRSINSQYWNDWTSPAPPGYNPDLWNQRFNQSDPNTKPPHELPLWDQSLSDHDPASWERIFQLYDQSQLAAAQAKWDADVAQYGGMLPGGGIMGPRPTAPPPAWAQQQGNPPPPPEMGGAPLAAIVDRIKTALASPGTSYRTLDDIRMDLMMRGGNYKSLPLPLRKLLDRAAQPLGSPNDPIGPQFKAELEAALGQYKQPELPLPPPPDGGSGSGNTGGGIPADPWAGATDEDKRNWLQDPELWAMSKVGPESGAVAIARAKSWLAKHGLTPANPKYEEVMGRVRQWAVGASTVHPASVLVGEYLANAGDWNDPPPAPPSPPTAPPPAPTPPPPDPTAPPPAPTVPPPTGSGGTPPPAPININVGAPPPTTPPPPATAPAPQNPQGIVYGGNVWDKALKTAMSGKTAGSNTGTELFSLQGSPDQAVPKLPAFQQMNYTQWNKIRNATPDAFNFLKGAYNAGNRDLDSEYQQMKYNAPIGDARYTSGIRTTR